MKTLWNKDKEIDQKILDFTIGNDREVDSNFITQDIIGSIGHILTLKRANVLSTKEFDLLYSELKRLYYMSLKGSLKIEKGDEDVHSMLEKLLIHNIGSVGKKVHTARSRNDQIATDISLWVRQESLTLYKELLNLSQTLREISEKKKDILLLGMTHLQPAMPSSIGAWLLGYSSVFLEDLKQVERAYSISLNCPLGSAAGYGVPSDIINLNRNYTSSVLGFNKPLEPVTAVQCSRGKVESTFLFAAATISTTAARFARDLILYTNPQFNFISLPDEFTTGSSIMPQKKNPDVAELIRASTHTIHTCLSETLSISHSVSSGYHRDFQRLKYPMIRGIKLVKQIVEILNYIVPKILYNEDSIEKSCNEDIYATKRALELVKEGQTFRDAYKIVAKEVENKSLPPVKGEKLPNIKHALMQNKEEISDRNGWFVVRNRVERQTIDKLLKDL